MRLFGFTISRREVTREMPGASAIASAAQYVAPIPLVRDSPTASACRRLIMFSASAVDWQAAPSGQPETSAGFSALDASLFGRRGGRTLAHACLQLAESGHAVLASLSGRLCSLPVADLSLRVNAVGDIISVRHNRLGPLDMDSIITVGDGLLDGGAQEATQDAQELEGTVLSRGAALAQNMGILGVVMAMPDASRAARAEAETLLNAKLTGAASGRAIVVPALGDLQQIGNTLDSIVDQSSLQACSQRIAAAYRCPPDLIYPEDSNRSTSEVADRSFLARTIYPLALIVSEALTASPIMRGWRIKPAPLAAQELQQQQEAAQ